MAEGVDAASFEFYEGIRIFIPGAITVGLAAGVAATFNIGTINLGDHEIIAIVAALGVGLLFYFVDAPARAAVIRSLQPTELLESWGAKARDFSVLNAYLLMLDTDIPGAIRARALYMGSMFRIGFESIYLLLLTSVGVLLSAAAWRGQSNHPRPTATSTTDRYVVVSLLLLIYLFAVRRDFINRPPRPPHDRRRLDVVKAKLERQSQTVGKFDVRPIHFSIIDAIIVALAAAAFLILTWQSRHVAEAFRAIPGAVVLALWAFRYFRGYRRKYWKGGVPVDAVHASFLASSAILLGLASYYRATPRLSVLEERGWSGMALLALVLIVSRGHERRLRGAYSSQNTWLTQHKKEVLRNYFEVPDGVPGQPAELTSATAQAQHRELAFAASTVALLLILIRKCARRRA
jgi:hypothetical protein